MAGLTSEVSFELPNRMRLLDRKPFSATLVRTGRTFETNHFTFRMVRIVALFLDAFLKLNTTAYASQL